MLVDSWEAGMQNWSEEILAEFATRRGYDAASVPARAHRPRGRERGRERAVPLGLPPHDRRRPGRRPLRHAGRAAARARPQALRGGGGGELADAAGRAPEQGPRGHPDGRVLDAPSRAQTIGPNTSPTSAKPPPPRTSTASRSWRPSPSPRSCPAGTTLRRAEVAGRLLHVAGREPVRDPHLRAPALPGPPAGHDAGPLRPALHAPQHLGRAVARLDRRPGPQLVPAAAGARSWATSPTTTARARPPPSTWAKTDAAPEPPAGYAYDYVNTEVLLSRMSVKDGRLVLPDGMSYRVLVAAGRPRPPHPAGDAQAARPRGRGRDRGRPQAARFAEPGGRAVGGRRSAVHRQRGVGRLRRAHGDRTCLRTGQGLLRPAAGRGPGRG